MTLERSWSRYSTVIGTLSCAMIALAFLVPWYSADYEPFYGGGYRVEYSVGIGESDFRSIVAIVLALSLVASIMAAVLSFLGRRASGVVIGLVSAGLLLAACGVFYFRIIDALNLNSFVWYAHLNRTWTIETGPMLGWWIAAVVPAVQGAQAVVLAYSGPYAPQKSP